MPDPAASRPRTASAKPTAAANGSAPARPALPRGGVAASSITSIRCSAALSGQRLDPLPCRRPERGICASPSERSSLSTPSWRNTP